MILADKLRRIQVESAYIFPRLEIHMMPEFFTKISNLQIFE